VRWCEDLERALDAVIEIHVGVAGRAVERLVAARRPRRRVTRGIGLANVGFDFDDDAAGDDTAAIVDQDQPEEIAGNGERGAIVERARWLHCAARRRAAARAARRGTCAARYS